MPVHCEARAQVLAASALTLESALNATSVASNLRFLVTIVIRASLPSVVAAPPRQRDYAVPARNFRAWKQTM
jgi:hypothetical protein